MMRGLLIFGLFLMASAGVLGQTTSVTSGDWTDPTIWSTGTVPGSGTIVNAAHPITLNQNITIAGGNYRFGYDGTVDTYTNVTDPPGGNAQTLAMSGGTLLIRSGVTTFEGAATFNGGTVIIYGGATLIVGPMTINNGSNTTFLVYGTLIINGNFTNDNNGTGTFTINSNGVVQVNGDYLAVNNGSVAVTGGGDMFTTGKIDQKNSSTTVFGSSNECLTGPCSGANLALGFTNSVTADQVICSGSSAATLVGSTNYAGSPAAIYQWQSAITAGAFSNITGATSANYSPGTMTSSRYFRRGMSINNGTNYYYSAPVLVTVVSSTGGWLGTTNDWNTASNWCSNSVPTSSTVVSIAPFPSGSSKVMPVILNTVNASALDITIASGASLTINSGGTLSIYGNFTNNGTFTDNSSTSSGVSFVGTSTQTISGTTANTFNNLTLNNTSGSTPAITISSNNVTVNSNLVMTTGLTNLSGFTITLGTSSSPGTLTYTAGRFYNGNITRYFPTTAVTVGTTASLFPIGTSTDYRPIYFGNAGLSATGTIKVRHTSSAGTTDITNYTDNGGTVDIRSNSFWTVTTANGIGTGTHAVRTEGTGFGTVGAVTDLRITLATGIAPGSDGSHSGTTTNPQVNRTGLTTAQIANSFYWGSINASQTPLPVTLISFTGRQLADQIVLDWSTATEEKFDYFKLEKSNDGNEFFEIAQIPGHGTSTTVRNYSHLDRSPFIGRSYYRLTSVDFDGETKTFELVAVDYSGEKSARVFPNPVTDGRLNIELSFTPESPVMIILTDLAGVEVGRYESMDQETSFGATLKQGTYLARVSADGFNKVLRVIVK